MTLRKTLLSKDPLKGGKTADLIQGRIGVPAGKEPLR